LDEHLFIIWLGGHYNCSCRFGFIFYKIQQMKTDFIIDAILILAVVFYLICVTYLMKSTEPNRMVNEQMENKK